MGIESEARRVERLQLAGVLLKSRNEAEDGDQCKAVELSAYAKENSLRG